MTISVSSKEYDKIEKLEVILNRNDLVSDFYILRFNNQNTFYRIIYNGSPKTFLNNFTNENVELVKQNDIWSMK